jgi:arsenical pump membrane protein
VSEAAALVALAVCLAAAVVRPRWAPDWAVAVAAATILVAAGVLSFHGARHALAALGPTVGFLAALLILGDGCRRSGVFDTLGAAMAAGAGGRAHRLLAFVFAAAAVTTAVLGLDATVVLLTPIVFATAARLRARTRPHVYACTHLANSASLLLPSSNLTNLLVLQASGLAFARFAELMALPWLAALLVEWIVLTRSFATDLKAPLADPRGGEAPAGIPLFALAVLTLTLIGLGASSAIGVAPAWIAGAGAVALLVRTRPSPAELLGAAQPQFLLFVLGLGVVVRAASVHGLSSAVDSLVPHGTALPALLAVAGVAALLSNLVNNLPATLVMLPVAAANGPAAVLAMLVGVNAGPNLTYTGSLATLLWRRIVHAHDQSTNVLEFTRLGLLTVPAVLLASTAALWLALRIT